MKQDWQESVRAAIIAAPVTKTEGLSQSSLTSIAVCKDVSDDVARDALRQQAKRQRKINAWVMSAMPITIAALVSLRYNEIVAVVLLGIGMVVGLGGMVAEKLLGETDVAAGARLLNHFSYYYLPVVKHDVVEDGVQLCLKDWHQTYGVRTFAAHEEQAALEYQVELEVIVHDVKREKMQQYITACLTPTIEAPLEPAPVAKLDPAAVELTETLASQCEAIKPFATRSISMRQ